MLTYICKDATAEGFDIIEARTHKVFTQDGLRGPLEMYLKFGFNIYQNNHFYIALHIPAAFLANNRLAAWRWGIPIELQSKIYSVQCSITQS